MQIRKNRTGFLLLVYVFFVVYCFVFGENGILERAQLAKDKDKIKQNIAELTNENAGLQKEYSIVSSNQTNGNFYRKEASKSGFISGNEKYIFFKSSGKSERIKTEDFEKEIKYPVEISHLRILWIVISVIIVLFYFWSRKKESKENDKMERDY